MRLELWLRGELPDGQLVENARRSVHWAVVQRLVNAEQQRAAGLLWVALDEAHQPAPPVFTSPVAIQWDVHYPAAVEATKKRAAKRGQKAVDWDGIVAALKPWQDMMVKQGWFKNDSAVYIPSGTVRVFNQSKLGPAMRLTIEEVGG